jgi:hypothetical protein
MILSKVGRRFRAGFYARGRETVGESASYLLIFVACALKLGDCDASRVYERS